MPTLTITKTYNDGTVLNESDLDNIKSSIETFINLTKLDGENIQIGSIANDVFDAITWNSDRADAAVAEVSSTGADVVAAQVSSTGAKAIATAMGSEGANIIASNISTGIAATAISSGTINNARITSATTGTAGIVQLNDTLTSSSTTQALTANMGRTLKNELDNKISINTSSSASQTNMPIGSIVLCVDSGAPPNRNASSIIRLGSDSEVYRYNDLGSGSVLAGTWRSCGAITGQGDCLFRRVS